MQSAEHAWSEPRSPRVRLTDRCLRFVRGPSAVALKAPVIVGVTHRNQPERLAAALRSVAEQRMNDGLAILVLDDSSDEEWLAGVDSQLLGDPRMVIATGRLGSPAQARNALLDLVDVHFPAARWIARLDADDVLAETGSLQALVNAGDAQRCDYVLGSNRLRKDDCELEGVNAARREVLLDPASLSEFIQAFCRGEASYELPSCNLLLRARSGIRYPHVGSAEDHWLVAGLLMHKPHRGCVVTHPVYAVYTLNGSATAGARRTSAWMRSRQALAQAAETWFATIREGSEILGWGQEGVVWKGPPGIFKRFYPYASSTEDLEQLRALASKSEGAIIDFDVCPGRDGGALIRLTERPLTVVGDGLTRRQMLDYLEKLYRGRLVTSNIKRDNLRITETGELLYIDIGRDIVPLTASRFLDCAARLYAIGALGWSDHELARRTCTLSHAEALTPLSGFVRFYGEFIAALHGTGMDTDVRLGTATPRLHEDVTLLIKACAQDNAWLQEQVIHIVGELRQASCPARIVLLVDPYEGPFLRQYAPGNLSHLLATADRLVLEGWLDEVWVAPDEEEVVRTTYREWFADPTVAATHTSSGAPLHAQMWALGRIDTPYVLQADIDVLVCISDAQHDVLGDMKGALSDESVWCVGFNIPQREAGMVPYIGEPDDFAPEIRFGLLHLARIRNRRPFVNPVSTGRFELMWHRALKHAQASLRMRSVRGGDSRSCYVHPRNEHKGWPGLPMSRDLLSQGMYPSRQAGCWDLVPTASWCYPPRLEDVVFLLFGRDTPPHKLERCLRSLRQQTDQTFGVIVIDDGSEIKAPTGLHHRLRWLKGRYTLIRRTSRVGYIGNFIEAANRTCLRPESLLVVLDQDDALLGVDVVERLGAAQRAGADLVNAPMFRPDKPLQLYPVRYDNPRSTGGGNVWAHLRAFRKSLFEQVPPACWLDAPDPDCLSDFITMVPMAELARNPVYLDGPYVYLHGRAAYSAERKEREAAVKNWLFRQQRLDSAPGSRKRATAPA